MLSFESAWQPSANAFLVPNGLSYTEAQAQGKRKGHHQLEVLKTLFWSWRLTGVTESFPTYPEFKGSKPKCDIHPIFGEAQRKSTVHSEGSQKLTPRTQDSNVPQAV